MHVALIDDDEAVLDSLRLYLGRHSITATCFSTADAFLKAKHGLREFACVVADVRMPGISGLELARRIANEVVPIILITGHGDIEMAVSAVKLGAFDFIEKPFDEGRLLESIKNAASHSQRKLDEITELSNLRMRFDSLTERQHQVMTLAAAGLSNKEIGSRLNISIRTVEIHRAWMMEKMGARNLAELVRMEMRLRSNL
jgi:two-component system response regulator FixJ